MRPAPFYIGSNQTPDLVHDSYLGLGFALELLAGQHELGSSASVVSPFQSPLKASDQALSVAGFGQEANGSSLEHSRADRIVWKGRNENNRRVIALGYQQVLQLDTAKAGHLYVGDDAR
jgi:hypothetical protein